MKYFKFFSWTSHLFINKISWDNFIPFFCDIFFLRCKISFKITKLSWKVFSWALNSIKISLFVWPHIMFFCICFKSTLLLWFTFKTSTCISSCCLRSIKPIFSCSIIQFFDLIANESWIPFQNLNLYLFCSKSIVPICVETWW